MKRKKRSAVKNTEKPIEDKALPWSGERFMPGMVGDIAVEHLHRYAMAQELAKKRVVLDIACGEGYGSSILAKVAKQVVGVDISEDAVKHAQQHYQAKNLEFRVGSCAKIPVADSSIDLVVSFETIEHHDQHQEMMAEIRRVLKPEGALIISSPEKQTYSIARGFQNPFHVKELSRQDFEELLNESFKNIAIYGQRVVCGSGIFGEERSGKIVSFEPGADLKPPVPGMLAPMYLIAIASNSETPNIPSSFYEQSITENEAVCSWVSTVISERDKEVVAVKQVVFERDIEIVAQNQAIAERDIEIAALNQAIAERDAQIATILNSRSWRATRSLRSLIDRARKIRSLAGRARRAVARRGGAAKTALALAKLYQSEGLSGVKIRLRRLRRAAGDNYAEWIRDYDTLTAKDRQRLGEAIEDFTHKPLISIVIPCYNSNPEWLKAAIESVRAQVYPNWELCIADDASTDSKVGEILKSYSLQDPRIKVIFREKNGHICAASNSALSLATGEYVGLLDHDDLLAKTALFWVADAINKNPSAGLIYSDEDKIDEHGQRSDPYFKSDWNYDLFLSQNVICHLGVYKTEILREIGGFREGYEGSQDHDLALRCVEKLDPSQIIHIPRILYHWRSHKDSTARDVKIKDYFGAAGVQAINDHFKRKNIAAVAEQHTVPGFYRVRYQLPESPPEITLIIPTRNNLNYIRRCVTSILTKTDYRNYKILIVDNGSDDLKTLQYFDLIKSDPRVRVLRDDRPFNFSALNNRAVEEVESKLVAFVNDDIEVINQNWLSEMVSIAIQSSVGAVGARLWYPNNTLQHGGVVLGINGVAGHSHKHLEKNQFGYFGRAVLQQSFSAVTAACLVIRRAIFLEVGGLEEENLRIAFNDVDLCLRLKKAGYRNVWTPYAELYHHESVSRGFEDTPEKLARFNREIEYMKTHWGDLLENDPAYSPNLTLEREDFSYAWPPRVEKDFTVSRHTKD